ncbi:unnamed protein product [Cuscuta epithymum]|uniref:Hydroxyethylthiazole kinase n=1 Tax=Cuscuta epithymum TaxID=186058 RepID=A0AAV0FPC4_9ASTE|nr:unnamed protein product [Cuscuta epithymum]
MANKVSEQEWGQRAWDFLSAVRHGSPLVQCITNFVSMDFMANTLLSAGASPAMIHSADEIPEFTPKAHALLVNMGTLTADWLPGMKLAAQVASQSGKPWVLDPVAAGVSSFRLNACSELLGLRPSVVRGNASEILALSKGSVDSISKGVDSVHESMDALEAAKSLAQSSGSIVAVSGAIDFVTDGKRVVGVQNGVPLLQKITATGCSVTALIAAFVSVDPMRSFEATVCAFSIFGIASEVGMESSKGPASLRTNLIDSLHGLDEDAILSRISIDNF